MNLILLDSDEAEVELVRSDPRAIHIVDILRCSVGDNFDIGFPDGRVGKACVTQIGEHALTFSVEWTGVSADLHPVTLIVGMPRPQTARRLLREMTAMGVRRIIFCGTDRGEQGYGQSKLWTSGEFERHLHLGAEQAFNPRLPTLELLPNLSDAVLRLDDECDRIALDNYEAPSNLGSWDPKSTSATVAFGAERGWSPAERDLLRQRGFAFFHLGERVLRLETAAAAGIAIALSRMGLL